MMVSRRRRVGTVLAAPMLCTAQPQPKFWVGEVGFARVVRRCRERRRRRGERGEGKVLGPKREKLRERRVEVEEKRRWRGRV